MTKRNLIINLIAERLKKTTDLNKIETDVIKREVGKISLYIPEILTLKNPEDDFSLTSDLWQEVEMKEVINSNGEVEVLTIYHDTEWNHIISEAQGLMYFLFNVLLALCTPGKTIEKCSYQISRCNDSLIGMDKFCATGSSIIVREVICFEKFLICVSFLNDEFIYADDVFADKRFIGLCKKKYEIIGDFFLLWRGVSPYNSFATHEEDILVSLEEMVDHLWTELDG